MKKYKTYIFADQDPIVKETLSFADKSLKQVARDSGISVGTLYNWKRKKTKRPQFCTIQAVGRACGKTLVWANKKK